LSLGVQSLQAPGLKVLGRLHGARQADVAFDEARRAGMDNVSLDFIFGWPGQTLDDWDRDLETVLSWEPDHLSLYSLIVEPGTPMATAVDRGQLQPMDDDAVADAHARAIEKLAIAGWEHYEISNWARTPAHRSIHNQIYWQNGRYFGLGAGAHGFLADTRMSNIRLPRAYIESVQHQCSPTASVEVIDSELSMAETMMLGLRLLVDGVSLADFTARHGERLDARYGAVIDRFLDLKLLEWYGDRLRLTPEGIMVSNGILAEFLPG
ncbi:MAG: coproporphyrinogen-III oxidase family protein, partial [Chloroflexota bacterium]